LFSQLTERLLDSTKQWNVLNISSPPFGVYYSTHSFKIVGDTLFNGEHYYKMGVSYMENINPSYNGQIMREDSTGKVWGATFYGNDLQHQGLMYDFSLGVGDTITPYSEMGYYQWGLNFEVLKVDTVFFANKIRRRLALGFTGTTDTCDYWYEGIGSTLGLMYPGLIIYDNSTLLLCYYESDTLLWHNSYAPSCWYTVNINSIEINPTYRLYPNPVYDNLYIDIDEKATLEIINIQGQIVDSKSLTEKVNNLDLSNIVSGVYTLRIKTEKGIAMKKLIKQ